MRSVSQKKWLVLSVLFIMAGLSLIATLLRPQFEMVIDYLNFNPIGLTTTSTLQSEMKTCNESLMDFNVYFGEMEDLLDDGGFTYETMNLSLECGKRLVVSLDGEDVTLTIQLKNIAFVEIYQLFYLNHYPGEKTNYDNIPTELFLGLLMIFSNRVYTDTNFHNLLVDRAGEYDTYESISLDPLRFSESRSLMFEDSDGIVYTWFEDHFTNNTRFYETIRIEGFVKPR